MMRALFDAWNRFFFRKESPLPLGVFRIGYGLAVMATLLLLKSDWLAWYGPHAWMSLQTAHELEPGTRLNVFDILPQDDPWIAGFFWVFLASAAMLTAGFLSRLNSIAVYVCLVSLQQRNLIMLHGGDTFLRVAGFFLMFAPAGAALSVDHWLRMRWSKEPADGRPRSLWAQRMIQLELSFLYLAAFLSKLEGAPWLRGTALFYVYHVIELKRFPVPDWMLEPEMLKLGTWLALGLEFSLGTLIWVKRLRYKVLLAGVIFHLSLEYSLNIPMFQWDILTGYLLFVDAEDYRRAWERVIHWWRAKDEAGPALPKLQS